MKWLLEMSFILLFLIKILRNLLVNTCISTKFVQIYQFKQYSNIIEHDIKKIKQFFSNNKLFLHLLVPISSYFYWQACWDLCIDLLHIEIVH